MVRSRQPMSQSSPRKSSGASELEELRRILDAKKSPKSVDAGASSKQSPLAPAGQTGSGSRSPLPSNSNSLLMNVFASRSEVATGSRQPDQESLRTVPSTTMDEPEENDASASSVGLMNPLQYVKREFQLATQSATHGSVATKSKQHQQKTTAKSASQAPNLEGADSDDSEELSVDSKTIQDVSQFLDKLHVSVVDTGKKAARPVDYKPNKGEAKAVEQPTVPSKPIVHDSIYGGSSSQDSDDSSNDSVNPETLAEIGAYIDAVSRVSDVDSRVGKKSVAASDAAAAVREGIKSPEDIESLIDSMNNRVSLPAGKATDANTLENISSVDSDDIQKMDGIPRPPPRPEISSLRNSKALEKDAVSQEISRPSPIYQDITCTYSFGRKLIGSSR